MKKIIAAAVATAFVAPAFAADVTLSGAVGYEVYNTDGATTGKTSQQDIIVTATEEMGNGMTVSVESSIEGNAGGTDAMDSVMTISGGFGAMSFGDDGDAGYNAFENKTDVAESGADYTIDSGNGDTDVAIQFTPNTGIEGLGVAVGYSAADADTEQSSGYGIQYAVGGFAVSYSSADADSKDSNATAVSASFGTGPFYVAVDSYKNKGGVDGASQTAIAATYSYGPGKFYLEQAKDESATAGNVDLTDTTIGVSYMMGPVNMYVQTFTDESGTSAVTSTDKTTFGVEYAF